MSTTAAAGLKKSRPIIHGRHLHGATPNTIFPFFPAIMMGALDLTLESSVPPSPNLHRSASRDHACKFSKCACCVTTTLTQPHGEDFPCQQLRDRAVGTLLSFFLFLRQRRRGNMALIATPPVPDCLNLVQHLQPRCLEDRFLPKQTRKKGALLNLVHFSNSFPTSRQSSDCQAASTSWQRRSTER